MEEFIRQNIIWLAIAAAALVAIIIIVIVACVKKSKRKKIDKSVMTATPANPAPPEHHRYDEKGKTYVKGDFIANKGKTVVAGSDIAPGKYSVLTTIEGVDAFNVRINGFVREIKHGSAVVLGDGDTFCPVSHSVILR